MGSPTLDSPESSLEVSSTEKLIRVTECRILVMSVVNDFNEGLHRSKFGSSSDFDKQFPRSPGELAQISSLRYW